MIASTALNVFGNLLKLDLKAHLLPENGTERQITRVIILTHPNMIITEDEGALAKSTSSYLTFIAMKDQLFHL